MSSIEPSLILSLAPPTKCGVNRNLHFLIFAHFGYQIFIYVEKYTREKLDSKSCPSPFMDYADETKAYHIWNLTKSKIVITSDVIFYEVMNSIASNIKPLNPLVLPTPSAITIYFPKIKTISYASILFALSPLAPPPFSMLPLSSTPLFP
jgi:hypothetical protein